MSLYHYLCELTGYEDHVKNLRMMNNVRDNFTYESKTVLITSGSFGEGLEMYGSDIDLMIVVQDYEVHENMRFVVHNLNKSYVLTNLEDATPGFTYLALEYTNNVAVLQQC